MFRIVTAPQDADHNPPGSPVKTAPPPAWG